MDVASHAFLSGRQGHRASEIVLHMSVLLVAAGRPAGVDWQAQSLQIDEIEPDGFPRESLTNLSGQPDESYHLLAHF